MPTYALTLIFYHLAQLRFVLEELQNFGPEALKGVGECLWQIEMHKILRTERVWLDLQAVQATKDP